MEEVTVASPELYRNPMTISTTTVRIAEIARDPRQPRRDENKKNMWSRQQSWFPAVPFRLRLARNGVDKISDR
jgi:hypothetical protein